MYLNNSDFFAHLGGTIGTRNVWASSDSFKTVTAVGDTCGNLCLTKLDDTGKKTLVGKVCESGKGEVTDALNVEGGPGPTFGDLSCGASTCEVQNPRSLDSSDKWKNDCQTMLIMCYSDTGKTASLLIEPRSHYFYNYIYYITLSRAPISMY